MFPRIPPVVQIILLLAVFGFLFRLYNNPLNMLVIIGLSVLVFVLVRNYLRKGTFFSGAGKQKTTKPKASPQRAPLKKQPQQARKNHPFRVIEGSKGKTKENNGDHDPHNHISQ
ncbi:hypothetical protein NDK47_15935 [Brevibacillus ruminantium]|uniref:Uncharacterized protein n=1 Tax=Brevibacillus ruminantium TaxID=2950604 RepID=A0ABY4WEC8_9BACL|nr:hypothetical protein [Brevibacillus ruminantium]USG63664.1 hypothetical protein NDK47_15935 [Brevibacillus ruminantium]